MYGMGRIGVKLREDVFHRMDKHTDTPHSELDVLMLGCTFPQYTSVTAKKSLKWAPFLGWFSTFLLTHAHTSTT